MTTGTKADGGQSSGIPSVGDLEKRPGIYGVLTLNRTGATSVYQISTFDDSLMFASFVVQGQGYLAP
jgi:hypothetical protein